MSSQISATLLPNSILSGFDQVSNILLKKKLPFEVVEIVFKFLPTTYLESTLGATLEQLISYSKHTTFDLLEKQLRDIKGGYEIKHDGTVIKSNIDCCTSRVFLVCL